MFYYNLVFIFRGLTTDNQTECKTVDPDYLPLPLEVKVKFALNYQ